MSKTNQQKVPANQTRSKRFFRRFVKIAFYCAVIFMVVLIVAAIVLRIMFPSDKLRDIAIEKIETSLQKDVTVGEIDFGIFSGLTLKDVSIKSRSNSDSPKMPLRSGHLDNLVIRIPLYAGLRIGEVQHLKKTSLMLPPHCLISPRQDPWKAVTVAHLSPRLKLASMTLLLSRVKK